MGFFAMFCLSFLCQCLNVGTDTLTKQQRYNNCVDYMGVNKCYKDGSRYISSELSKHGTKLCQCMVSVLNTFANSLPADEEELKKYCDRLRDHVCSEKNLAHH